MEDRWISTELSLDAFVPTKRISIAFNCGLVAVTLTYLGLYLAYDMSWLVACAVIGLILHAVSFVYVFKGPDMRYISVNILEIIFFMVANVVFLGTEYGFQLYVFGFIAAAMLLSLSAGGHGKILRPTKIIIALAIAFYTIVTLWFGKNVPIYSFNNPTMVMVVFMLNSLTTMGTIILFTGTYMATAASLADGLTQVALHDTLTSLLNRRGFYPMVAKSYERWSSTTGRCYLAMLDIDHFKEINDTYGHDGGDAVLRRLADVFREFAEQWPGLQASRWGGEEFLLMYEPKTAGAPVADLPFEPLRKEIESTVAEYEGAAIRWTVTIGVADCAEGNTPDDLISLSDKRLYEGKQAGRNRVTYET